MSPIWQRSSRIKIAILTVIYSLHQQVFACISYSLWSQKSFYFFHCVIGNISSFTHCGKRRGAKGDFLSVQRKWQSLAESGEGIAANPKEQQKQLFT